MNIVKYFKNLSILAAAGLAIANTVLGDPHFEFKEIGPYKNDVLPLIQKIRELASKILCKGGIDNAQGNALSLISQQPPDGRKLDKTYRNSRYEQGISKRHVENYHIISKEAEDNLRGYNEQELPEEIRKKYAPLNRPEKKVRSCVIGDWSIFISNIDFEAEDIRLFKVNVHDKKPCKFIMISVPYKGEIIVLGNDNKLHFIPDADTGKFATFVIDLYSLRTGTFWVVSTIYPWTWIAQSINETPQKSIDTISSQDKPSIKPKTGQIGHTNQFEALALSDEDDSENCLVLAQTSLDHSEEEGEKSELPPLEITESKQANDVESELTSLPKKKVTKVEKQNHQNKLSINEKQLREVCDLLSKGNPCIAEGKLNEVLRTKGVALLDFLVKLNENGTPIIVPDNAINKFCGYLFTTKTNKNKQKSSNAKPSVDHRNIIRYFASILSQEQLAYILLSAIVNGGNLDIVKCLVEECHCDVNAKCDSSTALHIASRGGHLGIVECLVATGKCDVNIQDKDGYTALHYASLGGHLGIVECLVATGKCDVNIQDNNGKTALHYAAYKGRLDVVECLVATGKCDVNIQDNDGYTALHYASGMNFPDIVKYLVACKCNVNIKDKDGYTALHYAARIGHLGMVECLVATGKCDVNIQDNDGHAALHYASALGHLEIVKCLVEKGKCDVNIQDKDGYTALHLAARFGHSDIVKYLVENGAEITDEKIRDYLREQQQKLNQKQKK